MNDASRQCDDELQSVVYVAESGIHGRGLFAARRIGRNEYIGTFFGPRARRNGMHVLWVYESDDEDSAIGRIGRNMLRFINHGNPCNAAFDGFDLFATRVIRADEEITIDYGYLE